MKVSIVLSTYNGEQLVTEQLLSILNQTRSADEVLITDDCSTDNTYKVVEQFIAYNELNNKWKLLKNQVNKGWRRSFIEGVETASGELIFLCDQDDIWYNNKLEIMENIMSINSHINVLVSYYDEKYSDGRVKTYPNKGNGKMYKIPLTKNFMNVKFPGCVFCLRATFAKKCNRYWKESMPHDGLYWRMGMFDGSLYEFRQPLIKQRKHSNSTFAKETQLSRNTKAKLNEISYTKEVIESIKRMLLDNNKDTNKNIEILETANVWNDERYLYFTNRELINGIKLMKYIGFYQTIRRYFLDLYIVVFNK